MATAAATAPVSAWLRAGRAVLDGAMGTALHNSGVPYDRCFELLNRTDPERVLAVHRDHLRAGAQAVRTQTFGAHAMRLSAHGLQGEVTSLNRAAVRLARREAGDRWVVGSIGPSGRPYAQLASTARGDVDGGFAQQCAALASAGVDALLLETFRCPQEALAALAAARREVPQSLPVWVGVSPDSQGQLAGGAQAGRFSVSLRDAGASAVGVNCGHGPASLWDSALGMLREGLPVLALPSVGVPGESGYPVGPEDFEAFARRAYAAGLAAVGGCCGATAAHVQHIARAASAEGSG